MLLTNTSVKSSDVFVYWCFRARWLLFWCLVSDCSLHFQFNTIQLDMTRPYDRLMKTTYFCAVCLSLGHQCHKQNHNSGVRKDISLADNRYMTSLHRSGFLTVSEKIYLYQPIPWNKQTRTSLRNNTIEKYQTFTHNYSFPCEYSPGSTRRFPAWHRGRAERVADR